MKCRKCGGCSFRVAPNRKNPNATDLICKNCGAWQKFATKDEIRLYESESSNVKTADEMLAALGFRKNTSACYSEELGKLLYEKPVMGGSDCEVIVFEDGEVTFYNLMRRALWMQPALIDAISAKCREMRWN